MSRFLLSGALVVSSIVFAGPTLAEPGVHEFLRTATPEQRREVREEMEDVREADSPQERREEKAEVREEIRDQLNKGHKPALLEGRASTHGAAPSGGGGLTSLVARAAAANGVPANVAHGVVMVESRYNAKATGRGGYIGLMQISYRTAKGMGYSGSRAGLYEPATNLQYGMKYLGEAYRQAGGNLCGAVSKYQGGHGVRGVTRAGAAYCGKVKKYMTQRAPGDRQVAELSREHS